MYNIWNYDGTKPAPRGHTAERKAREKPNKGTNEMVNVENKLSDESLSSINVASLEKKLKHEYKENINGNNKDLLKVRKLILIILNI